MTVHSEIVTDIYFSFEPRQNESKIRLITFQDLENTVMLKIWFFFLPIEKTTNRLPESVNIYFSMSIHTICFGTGAPPPHFSSLKVKI